MVAFSAVIHLEAPETNLLTCIESFEDESHFNNYLAEIIRSGHCEIPGLITHPAMKVDLVYIATRDKKEEREKEDIERDYFQRAICEGQIHIEDGKASFDPVKNEEARFSQLKNGTDRIYLDPIEPEKILG